MIISIKKNPAMLYVYKIFCYQFLLILIYTTVVPFCNELCIFQNCCVNPPPSVLLTIQMSLHPTMLPRRDVSMSCCRLCSLTLSRLVLLKSLGADLSSIIIAVKMQVSDSPSTIAQRTQHYPLKYKPSDLIDISNMKFCI